MSNSEGNIGDVSNFCQFCRGDIHRNYKVDGEVVNISFPRCGKYSIARQDHNNESLMKNFNQLEDKRYIISAVLRQASDKGKPITISKNNIEILIASALIPDTPKEILDKILLYFSNRPFDFVTKINFDNDYPRYFARDKKELGYVLHSPESVDYIEGIGDGKYRLTHRGWERLDDLKRKRTESRQAFVAMWLNEKEMGRAYVDGFYPALYETGYDPYRDDLNRRHNEKIDDSIIAEIRKSRILVADLTGIRGSVIFEAGFAKGIGIEVFWTCKKKDEGKIPFDIRQFPFIFWETHDQLKKKLKERIEALGLNI